MNCEDLKAGLVAMLYGELDRGEVRSVTRHLEECADCRASFDALRQASTAMRQWKRLEDTAAVPRPYEEPWLMQRDAVAAGAWQRLREWCATPLALPRWGLAGAAAAALCLFVAAARLDVEWGEGRLEVAWRGAASRTPAAADTSGTSSPVIAAQVAGLIQQSEDRQVAATRQFVQELAAEVNRQRQEDLQIVGYGLGELSQETQYRLAKTNRRLDQVAQYLISQGSSVNRPPVRPDLELDSGEESGVVRPEMGGQGDFQWE